MIQILVWWLLMQVLGWLALPTTMRIFRWLPDRGYSFTKALGLLLVSYILWVGASTGLLNNDLAGILFSILLLTAISAWFYIRCKTTVIPDIRSFLRDKWKLVVTVEVLFTVALVGWAVLRAYAPFKSILPGVRSSWKLPSRTLSCAVNTSHHLTHGSLVLGFLIIISAM
jgi:hypothetical protein